MERWLIWEVLKATGEEAVLPSWKRGSGSHLTYPELNLTGPKLSASDEEPRVVLSVPEPQIVIITFVFSWRPTGECSLRQFALLFVHRPVFNLQSNLLKKLLFALALGTQWWAGFWPCPHRTQNLVATLINGSICFPQVLSNPLPSSKLTGYLVNENIVSTQSTSACQHPHSGVWRAVKIVGAAHILTYSASNYLFSK